MKVKTDDLIAIVYKAVRPYLENGENAKKFVLRTNFPTKAYDERDSKTLKELGLAPSCALVIYIPC